MRAFLLSVFPGLLLAVWLTGCGGSDTDTMPAMDHSQHDMGSMAMPADSAAPFGGTTSDGVVMLDAQTIQTIGVRTDTVRIRAMPRSTRTTGTFAPNEQALHAVSLKTGGFVEKLYVDFEGARVRRGQPLLDLYSPELVATQQEYLLAVRHAERLRGSTLAGTDEDSRRLIDAARQRLALWDISEAQLRHLEQTGLPQRTLTLYAPAAGTVTRKEVVAGQQVMAGQTLFELADLSTLWLMADVYEQDLGWVRPGTEARIELPYAPGRVVNGRVDYVYDLLNPETRTAKARIRVSNPGLALKPQMFATVTLLGDAATPTPVVPADAVLRSGEDAVVLLALGGGRFQPVNVLLGTETGGLVQVLGGLQGGEQVVVGAQFLIDSEARLRSAVGAMMAMPGMDHSGMDMEGMDHAGMDMEGMDHSTMNPSH
jgi:RND family efflux transporter MFP subunit